MALVSKSQMEDFASAMRTKEALQMVDHSRSGGDVSARSGGGGAIFHTTGLSVPAYDAAGNLFGAGVGGRSRYGLEVPKNVKDKTLIRYNKDDEGEVFGQVDKTQDDRVIINNISKVEFERKRLEEKLPVLIYAADDVVQMSSGFWGKLSGGMSGFFFGNSDDDSFTTLVVTMLKLLLTAGVVIGAGWWISTLFF